MFFDIQHFDLILLNILQGILVAGFRIFHEDYFAKLAFPKILYKNEVIRYQLFMLVFCLNLLSSCFLFVLFYQLLNAVNIKFLFQIRYFQKTHKTIFFHFYEIFKPEIKKKLELMIQVAFAKELSFLQKHGA